MNLSIFASFAIAFAAIAIAPYRDWVERTKQLLLPAIEESLANLSRGEHDLTPEL